MTDSSSDRLAGVSLRRIFGFACQRMWTFMVFYSVVPYVLVADPRTTLYQNQIVSLFAFAVCASFIAMVYGPKTPITRTKIFVWIGGGMSAIGSLLTFTSDAATLTGVLCMTISAILTGLGSALLFILWVRHLYSCPTRSLMLVEFGTATAIALVVSLVLTFVPTIIAWVVVVAAPLCGSFLLHNCLTSGNAEDKANGEKIPLSTSTKALFAKALVGALVIGALQGFTDICTGYTAFSATDTHGVVLFLVGAVAALFLICIGALKRDPIDLLYRCSMLLMSMGFILMAFTRTDSTFYTSLSLAGYMYFIAFLLLAAYIISKSFNTGITRTLAIAIGTLYLGEGIGLLAGGAVVALYEADINIELISIACTLIFLCVHFFLFTENDLVRAGLGEQDSVLLPAAVTATAEPEAASEPAKPTDILQEAADRIVADYHLSPRESEVLLLLLQGRTMARIQEALFISAGTVSTHCRHIYQKTGVANRQQLIDLAFSKNDDQLPDMQTG